MNEGKLLGIDHGIKRIGLAVCDFSRLIARELTIINRKTREEDFSKINHIAKEQHVVGIIVGLPNNLDADPNTHTQADTVRLWVQRFSTTTDLPIMFWDEQLSSEDAKELAKIKRRKPQEPIDDLAARIILQSYLDSVKDKLVPDFP